MCAIEAHQAASWYHAFHPPATDPRLPPEADLPVLRPKQHLPTRSMVVPSSRLFNVAHPIFQQHPAALEQIRRALGALHPTEIHVRECEHADFAGVSEQAWLAEVLERIPDSRINHAEELLLCNGTPPADHE